MYGSPHQKVHRRRVAEQVIEYVASRIRDGVLAPGQRLPSERALAQTLGISRPIVREALVYMNRAGLVHTRHGSGTYVLDSSPVRAERELPPSPRPVATDPAPQPWNEAADGASPDAANLRWMFEFRMTVETEAAGLAALRANDSQLKNIATALGQFRLKATKEELGVEADFRFHIAVAEASNNPYLAAVLTNMADGLIDSVIVNRTRTISVRELSIAVEQEHRAIYECIAAKDATRARAAMRDHLFTVWQRVHQQVQTFSLPPEAGT